MTNNTYNGWTNYETWNIKLWMDNGDSDYWQEVAQEALEAKDFDKQEATYILAQAIADYHDEMQAQTQMPDYGPFADLLNAALREVNWYEIAENILSDIPV